MVQLPAKNDIPVSHEARLGSGEKISATQGIFPILRELEKGTLQVVGTGFYVTRYGLFVSARHVFDHIIGATNPSSQVLRIFHHTGSTIHIRHIRSICHSNHADIALGEADNFSEKFPDDPLQNIRPTLTLELPKKGEKLVTFAYPRNKVLDFSNKTEPVVMFADRFEGDFEDIRKPGKYDEHKIEAYQTSIPLEGGCSGGPVFDETGRVVAVACSGFDFGKSEHQGQAVSFVTPIRHCLDLYVNKSFIPKISWEYGQITEDTDCNTLTFQAISKLGHINFDPPLM